MSAEILRLGPAFERTNLTPDQAILSARPYLWEKVLIAGFCQDSERLIVRTSHMTRQEALWIVEHLKKHVLDEL